MDQHGTTQYKTAPTTLEPLLTVAAVCGLLAVSRQTVYRLIRAGELHPSRVGERLRFVPEDVRDYLERNRVAVEVP
jgi:excisionase family DNA binding protein